MASLSEISKTLKEFSISGCHIRSKEIISFSTQKTSIDDDPLEVKETMLFFYYPDETNKEKWAFRGWDDMTEVYGCPCYYPNERWVFLSGMGEVYVVGQGDDGDEKPIKAKKDEFFKKIKCIDQGHAYAISSKNVYKRIKQDTWISLNSQEAIGAKNIIHDIDGFSENDIYVCGDKGGLWNFNGKKWSKKTIPVKDDLEKIVCTPEGHIYIATGSQKLLIGKGDKWEAFKLDIEDVFDEMVYYDSKVILSTFESLYDVTDGIAKMPEFGLPKMTTYSHLASGFGILVVGGEKEAYMFNGEKWIKIYQY